MRSVNPFLQAILLLSCLCWSDGARILAIFPTPSISHQLPYHVIMKALAARGHEVTVISPNPLEDPPANYTDIDLSFSYDYWRSLNFTNLEGFSLLQVTSNWGDLFCKIADMQLSSPQLQKFIKSQKKFDLVIMEKIMLQSFYGLVHHVGSPPVIGISSMAALSPTFTAFGNPNNPSCLPNFFSPYTDHMSFWERLHNTYLYLAMEYVFQYKLFPAHEVVMRKHFGSGPPPIRESEYNDSLLILNNHWSTNYPRPLLPNVVELSGLHVLTKPKPLPKNIQMFLDGAKDGVIYFSLGSNVRSEQLPPEKVKSFLDAFAEIPQRVVWKWESETLPGKPSNVMVSKWLPQQSILAHPNIKAFIMQGGLQSIQEAAYYAIPLIAIPFFSDQKNNAAKINYSKIGIRIPLRDVNKETILDSLGKILKDSSYRENMKKFAAIYREDMGEPSLKRAIWWIEYVLRHNGARHLRSAAMDLAWYQYLLLDVVAVLSLAILTVIAIIYVVLKKLLSFARGHIPTRKLKKK